MEITRQLVFAIDLVICFLCFGGGYQRRLHSVESTAFCLFRHLAVSKLRTARHTIVICQNCMNSDVHMRGCLEAKRNKPKRYSVNPEPQRRMSSGRSYHIINTTDFFAALQEYPHFNPVYELYIALVLAIRSTLSNASTK